TPQKVAVQAVRRSIGFSEKVGMKVLGVVENMSTLTCPNCGEEIDVFGSGGGEKMAEELDISFLGSIPLDPEIMESAEKGRSLIDAESNSSEAFENIVVNLKKELGE
ncbi:MAG: P-loop NTPase, partial [Candidatus Thermoplasmatota archaeon]